MTVGELIVTLGLDSSKFNKGLDEAKSGGISLGNILMELKVVLAQV